MLHHGKYAPVPTILRPVAGIKFEIRFLSLNIYVIYVRLCIKYCLMWFEIILVLILFKLRKKTSQQFRNSGCIKRLIKKSFY